MAIRTIRQLGLAYGTVPASITVLLDGIEIYAGPATTVDAPVNRQDPSTNVLFSWEQETTDTSSKNLVISVTGSQLLLNDTQFNYSNIANLSQFTNIIYPRNINSVQYDDPYIDVMIDGIPQTRIATPGGEWYWLIPVGSTFQATFDCVPGINYPDWSASVEYPFHSQVVYQNAAYLSSTTYPTTVGIAPTDDRLAWVLLPIPTWDINNSYILNDRVYFGSNTQWYRAIQNVPIGVDITNTNYWYHG